MQQNILSKLFVAFVFIILLGSPVFAGGDSVNWGNLNLNYKPPKVAEGEEHGQVVEPQADFSDARVHLEDVNETKNIVKEHVTNLQNNPKADPEAVKTATTRLEHIDKQVTETQTALRNANPQSVVSDPKALEFIGGFLDSALTEHYNPAAQPEPQQDYSSGDYNTPYLDELTLMFEKALTDDLAVSLTGFYKKRYNLSEAANIQNGVVNPDAIQTGPPGIGGVPGINNVQFEWETISPRIGLTYTFGEERKTLLRSSYSDYSQGLSGTGLPLGGLLGGQTPVQGGFNYGIDTRVGEMYGFGGPAVSCGKVNKVCTLQIVDNEGRLVGTVTEDDLERDPYKTHRLLVIAEESSERNFSRQLHGGGYSICARNPIERRTPTSTFTSDEIDRLPSSGRSISDLIKTLPTLSPGSDGFNLANGGHDNQGVRPFNACGPDVFPSNDIPFRPGGVLGLRLGSSYGDLLQAGDLLNAQLNCKSTGFRDASCFSDFDPCSFAYAVENAHLRFPLKKKASGPTDLTPNDPFYWKDYGKKKSKVKKRLKKISSGLKLSIGASTDAGFGVKKKEALAEDQWGLRKIGFLPKSDPDSAWNIVDGSQKNVVIAVIDSGLDMDHPDAPEYIWTNTGETPGNGIDDDYNGYVDDVHGWNFVMNNNDLTDFYGHGTFVSGIIAAKANNGIGIAGINPGAQIMALKVVTKEGETDSFSIFRAIHYAVNHGARIINISLGARGVSKMEQLAINRANREGVLVVVASGNVNENIGDHGPAAADRVLAVGAIDVSGERSTVSNWGPNNALLAPGEAIYSLRSQNSYHKRAIKTEDLKYYYTQDGTSFSAPMVTATASLLLVKDPSLTNAQIEDILLGTASEMRKKEKEQVAWESHMGAGLLNATAALKADPNEFSNVRLTRIRVNQDDRKKLESVDVFATVRGPKLTQFIVEVGKGKHAKKFKPVAGPYFYSANHAWIARIDKKELRGSTDWIVQIKALDTDGNEIIAKSPLSF